MLVPLDEHQLLVFWTQLFVLVVTARAFGYGMRRIGLPSVIGELLAGLVLGPSIFGRIWEDGFEWFLPDDEMSSAALLAVGWVGVALLLVVTGFETDLGLIRKLGRPAALVTTGSLVVPLAAGIVVGYLLPGDLFVGEGTTRIAFALFVALALSVSSLAVIAKILSEMGLMRRDFGQITLAAGMANDVIGWLLLGVFTGIATSGSVSVLDVIGTVAGIVLFVALAFTVGQRLVDFSLRRVRSSGENLGGALTVAIVCMLGFGVATQRLGVEAVLGAFVAGVILHRSRFQQSGVLELIETLTVSFLAPLFFATAGLRLDLGSLDSSEALLWTGVVIAVAIVTKFAGAYAGARAAGRRHRAGLALGAGLNARGALEIVIGTVGLSLGVFNTAAYTIIVLVPVITSVFASISLRLVVRNYAGTPDEIERLEREEALERNLVVRSDRLLIPTQGGPASIAAAQLLHFAWPPESGVTVLSALEKGDDDIDVSPLENVLHGRELEHRQVRGVDPVEAVIEESRLGYGAIGLGAAEHADGQLITPFVDGVLSESELPVVLVRRARNIDRPLPGAFTRALVPVAGTPASRAAQEVAFHLSAQLGTEILLAHVVSRPRQEAVVPRLFHRLAVHEPEPSVGEKVLEQSAAWAADLGVETRSVMRTGSAAETVLATVEEVDADLVVLGANLRQLAGRPFLGHTVEHVLHECDATIAVVMVPFDL